MRIVSSYICIYIFAQQLAIARCSINQTHTKHLQVLKLVVIIYPYGPTAVLLNNIISWADQRYIMNFIAKAEAASARAHTAHKQHAVKVLS